MSVRGGKGWLEQEHEPFTFFASCLPLEQGRRRSRAYHEPGLEAAIKAIPSHLWRLAYAGTFALTHAGRVGCERVGSTLDGGRGEQGGWVCVYGCVWMCVDVYEVNAALPTHQPSGITFQGRWRKERQPLERKGDASVNAGLSVP